MVYGKAVVTTGLTAVGEGTSWAKSWIAKAEEEGGKKMGELKSKAGEMKDQASAKAGEVKKDAKKEVNGKA